MDKFEFKKQVMSKAREAQEKVINDFRTRINEIRQSEGNIMEDSYDMDQGAYDESSIEIIDRLADQLNFAVEEIDLLDRMKSTVELHDHVTLGSVVETDKKVFFPSVSVEKFKVNEKELFGLSQKAPLYEVMKGKKPGDTFEYKGEAYKIIDVY